MTITTDSIRSGICGMSAFSRISVSNDKLGKAGFRQLFNRAEAQKANRETIEALKTAVLDDPRYSGMRDKVEEIFGGMDPKHAIRASDVKKAFAKLDKCALGTDAGKRSFLVQDLKMRLTAGALSAAPAGKGDGWAFSFRDEWKSGPRPTGSDPDLIQWSIHFRKLEPLMGMMVDELAARKGGVQNITAEDAVDLSWKVRSLLTHIGRAVTDSSISARYHFAAFEMLANAFEKSPAATASPLAAMRTAEAFQEALSGLASFETSPDGSKFAVEDGIAWMNAMCAPLDKYSTLLPFARNHMDFNDALKLGLPPEKAERLTLLAANEFKRTSGTNDMAHDLLDANSVPRRLLEFPDLGTSEKHYRMAASLIEKFDSENIGAGMRNLALETISSAVRAGGAIPETGAAETTAPNGERVRLEWAFRNGDAVSVSVRSFGRVA